MRDCCIMGFKGLRHFWPYSADSVHDGNHWKEGRNGYCRTPCQPIEVASQSFSRPKRKGEPMKGFIIVGILGALSCAAGCASSPYWKWECGQCGTLTAHSLYHHTGGDVTLT